MNREFRVYDLNTGAIANLSDSILEIHCPECGGWEQVLQTGMINDAVDDHFADCEYHCDRPAGLRVIDNMSKNEEEDTMKNYAPDYYMKATDSTGKEICVPIEDDAVYTHCPICGKEHRLDSLVELLQDEHLDFDLYGSGVYCDECTAKRSVNK